MQDLIDFLNWEDEGRELGFIPDIIESPSEVWGLGYL
jgi:hypothetical protein